MPDYLSTDDIKIFISKDQVSLKIIGSGNPINKYYRYGPSLKKSKMRNLINYKSRDWELWFNLKDRIKNNTLPAIQKKRNGDNTFTVKLLFDKVYLDRTSHFNYVIPTMRFNKTTDWFHYDMYRTKIPKSPDYVHRFINLTTFDENTGKSRNTNKTFEILTVHTQVSN